MNSTINIDDSLGFWGKPTATDWCENNYDITFYIAEFFNTISSFFMICAGLFGVFMHARGFDSSILFHGTLLFSLQLLDEVPMLFCVLVLCYSVIENKKEKKFGIWFPITLILWGIIITLTMIISGIYQDKIMQSLEFYVFQANIEKSSQMLLILGSIVFLIGYVGWHVDFHFCSNMNSLPYNMPNPQLHAWCYLMCVLVIHDRSKMLQRDPQILWIAHLLPYVKLYSSSPSLPNSYSEKI
ncbi:6129_t:CDS:2 [Diversispora eburnea]|uniref:6129_t:CDS:1 n=1 Tax=Diversispora eburnea TaxID=1213867 RepID=A0A9N8ZEN2_9GLOM|nr:6129_t:CDS:2 [Diversispora eburnea]